MVKRVFSYIFVCLIAIFLCLLCFLGIFKFAFNEENVLNFLDSSNYYDDIKKVIIDTENGYIEQSGLNESIINDSITIDVIRKDVNFIVNSIFNDNKFVKNNDFKELLTFNINNYIKDNNIYYDVNQKKSVDKLIVLLENSYYEELMHPKIIPFISDFINMYNKYIDKIIIFVFSGISIFCIVLFILNFKNNFFIYLITSIIFSIVLTVCLCIFLYFRLNLADFFVYNFAFTNLFKFIFTELFYKLSFIATILLFVAIISFVFETNRK